MSLRFVTGRSGTGKTAFIEQEIAEQLKEDPIGAPIIVIVPDQMSFSMEHNLSVQFGLKGLIRAQVLTFKRLAWRILQETGGIARKEVDQFGYRMLIRSVLEENQEAFQLFRQAASKRGFTEQITSLLKEFSRYCLDVEAMTNLQAQLTKVAAPRTLIDKTTDLQLLLTKIEEKLGTYFVDSEGHLQQLASQIRHSTFVSQASIYMDGFENFTTREYEIVTELMKHAKNMTVVLPIDVKNHASADHELFYSPAKTMQTLTELANAEGVVLEPPVQLTEPKRFLTTDLRHVEAVFDQFPAPQKRSDKHITIIEAVDRRAEVHAVARNIRKQMLNGKRYNDIAVLYRQPEVYDELITTIFPQYDIPVFISQQKSMLHHPLIELTRSVLEVISTGWSYETIFRAVKTDLFFPHGADRTLWRERLDRLENFVLANGISGYRWFDEKRWHVKKYRGLELYSNVQTDEERALEAEILKARHLIREPLATFESQLKDAANGREVAEVLFTFMEQLRVYDKIIDLRKAEEEQGRLLLAAEHEQAWQGWLNVLDQFVLMFGERSLTVKEAIRILDEGFETLTFSRIPPAIDQVTVSNLEISSMANTPVVFVMGLNEGVLPKRMDHEGLLSDTDREWFEQLGIVLAPTSKRRLMDENYIAYRTFTAAREQLMITYPIADEEGKALLPSLYIAKFEQWFSDLPIEQVVLDPVELADEQAALSYLVHPRVALSFIVQEDLSQGMEAIRQAVLTYYRKNSDWSAVISRIEQGQRSRQQTERITPQLTEALYGQSFTSSVSRIESYYSCPFQHFATYGLALQERPEFTLDPPAIGDLFHAALKWIADETMRLGIAWSSLTKEQCWSLAREAIEALTPIFFRQILLSTKRYLYIQRKLIHIIQRTLHALSQQAKTTTFHPVAIEAAFGPGDPLPPLDIPLRHGRTMKLRGRIDRIDATEIQGKHFLRVVDYKSSPKALDLTEVYYGLSLQMLTYLDVALDNAEEWLGVAADPAGVLYVYVHNPMLRTEAELQEASLEREIVKSYKMRGYILENADVAKGMDEEIGSTSIVIPAAIKKDGSFYQHAKVLASEDWQLLRSFVRNRHQRAGEGMLAGDVRVYPYRLKDQMPCQYCQYRSVCQYDETDPNASHRSYQALDPLDAISKMKKELNEDAHS